MAHLVLTVSNWLNFSAFGNVFSELKGRYQQYRSYKQTVKDLSRLTDKELNDIGINRSMIHSVAMETYLDDR